MVLALQLNSPEETALAIAKRLKAERLRLGWKQQTLAERSGVSLPTLKRFESSGQTSFLNVLQLCHALGVLDEFAEFLKPPPALTLDELEKRGSGRQPQRGKR